MKKNKMITKNGFEMTFEEWYGKLIDVAKKEDLLWLISNDAKDHREAYEDGDTPEDELSAQAQAAS